MDVVCNGLFLLVTFLLYFLYYFLTQLIISLLGLRRIEYRVIVRSSIPLQVIRQIRRCFSGLFYQNLVFVSPIPLIGVIVVSLLDSSLGLRPQFLWGYRLIRNHQVVVFGLLTLLCSEILVQFEVFTDLVGEAL